MNEEDAFVFIYPKRLVLINQKHCDFCNKQNTQNSNSYVRELVHLFGYQFCQNCKDICQKQIDVYCKYNKEYPTNDFIRDFNLSKTHFNVLRSNGDIEKNWKIDYTQFIKFHNKKYIIPLCSSNVFKYVNLESLCCYNKTILNYDTIQNYLSKFFN
jgi:hypothetical protein